MAEDLVEHFGIPRTSIRHIPNPVDADEIRALSEGPSPFAGPGPHFLGAGRLAAQKGFDLMIEAFARLAKRLPDAQLWVLGEGEGRVALEEQAERLGLASRVHVVGHVPNPYVWMRHASAFVLSSRYEGLPNVVLEAMAMEVPVLATRCGGMEAFAKDGEDALLVDAGSADALARGILRLANDAELRRRLASAARSRVEKECSLARRMAREVERYDRLLGV
jgi:glycosyltransferase involved in cell wall biosynthesis